MKRVHPDGFTMYEYDVTEETEQGAEQPAQEVVNASATDGTDATEQAEENK